MSTLCLPSRELRDAILSVDSTEELIAGAATPAIEKLLSDAVIMGTPATDLSALAEVEFWVPGWLGVDELRQMLAAMPKLRVVQAQSAGIDRFLGLFGDGTALCDARGVHGSATAEWALTAILSVQRQFPRFERARQQQFWDEPNATDELADKTVLIVGAGDVGTSLQRRILACDATPVMVARTARKGVHGLQELSTLLPQADIVVVIVPLTSETIGLVDATFLAQMADGALFVNAARGPVVRTDALLTELQSGRLRAAVDVTDPEPLPSDHPLWKAPNLLITPHVGGSVYGVTRRVAVLVRSQLQRFVEGEPLGNVVLGEY